MQNPCQKVAKLLNTWGVRYGVNNNKFIVKRSKYKIPIPPITEDIAYVLGIICGDGCLKTPQPRKCGGARFTIAIYLPDSIDGKTQSEYICELFRKNFGYTPRVFKQEKVGKRWLEIRVNSVVIYAYLVCLGLPIGKKYGKLKVPAVVYEKKLFGRFLQGLVDSDGHFTRSELVIVQKDEIFLNQIVKASFKFLGIKFTPPKANTKEVAGKLYKWYYIRSKMYFSSNRIEKLGPGPVSSRSAGKLSQVRASDSS